MSFFSLDTPLNDYDKSILAEIESLPADKQQDAIALLFGAIVNEYESASEEQRATMSPFCKFFAELDCDIDAEELEQSPDAQKPQHLNNAEAFGITGKINVEKRVPYALNSLNQ